MILVYTPVTSSCFGSSEFLRSLLEEKAGLLSGIDLRIVVDGGAFSEAEGGCPADYHGFPLIDCRSWSLPTGIEVTHLIFVAGDRLHKYCYDALNAPKLGPAVAI